MLPLHEFCKIIIADCAVWYGTAFGNPLIMKIFPHWLLLLAGMLCAAGLSQQSFGLRLSEQALLLTEDQVEYDPSYFIIPYPGGDVPAGKGVCTDVVIRAYRKLGIDLQWLVHEDMTRHFGMYPQRWGLKRPDTNIDHRRVPNLMMFFSRFGIIKPNSEHISDYMPGDIVAWDLGNGVTHIGIVVHRRSPDGERWMVVHNIGAGQVLEDVLLNWKVIAHYSYDG